MKFRFGLNRIIKKKGIIDHGNLKCLSLLAIRRINQKTSAESNFFRGEPTRKSHFWNTMRHRGLTKSYARRRRNRGGLGKARGISIIGTNSKKGMNGEKRDQGPQKHTRKMSTAKNVTLQAIENQIFTITTKSEVHRRKNFQKIHESRY